MEKASDQLEKLDVPDDVEINTSNKGVNISFRRTVAFEQDSAELTEKAKTALKKMLPIIGQMQNDIEISGHTDESDSNKKYPSNWELSSNRASTVVRFFISNGMKKNRLRAIGYADTQPKLPNRDASGAPIPDNMIANRRIILRINRQPIYEEIRLPKFRRKEGDKKSNKTQIN